MTAHAYTKVYRSITQSTVWVGQPAHVKLSWIVMLAEADEIGRVTTPVPVLAKLAEVTLQEFEEALRVFLSPDPYSRSKEFDGRRIEPLDGEEEFGGFRILNHEKYRKKRDSERRKEQNREAQERWREAHPEAVRKPRVSQDVSSSKQDKPESAEVSHKKPIPSASASASACEGDPGPDPSQHDQPDRLGEEQAGTTGRRSKRGGRGSGVLTGMPDGWSPNDHHRKLAEELRVSLTGVETTFREKTRSRGIRYVDWDAGFCTWLRNERKYADAEGRETHADSEAASRPGLTPEQVQSAIAADRAKQRALVEAQSKESPAQSSLVSADGAIDLSKVGAGRIMQHPRRPS